MLQILYLLLYGFFCIWLAEVNYKWIDQKGTVKHFWNGLIHVVAASLAFYFFGWKAFICVLLVARLVFDLTLNNLRGLPFDYVSPNPKSIVDKIEKYLFKTDSITPKIIYLALLICLQIL